MALEKTRPAVENNYECIHDGLDLTDGLAAGRHRGGHHDLDQLPVLSELQASATQYCSAPPVEGAVDLAGAQAGPVRPDVGEGQTGEVAAGAEGEQRGVEEGHESVAAAQGALHSISLMSADISFKTDLEAGARTVPRAIEAGHALRLPDQVVPHHLQVGVHPIGIPLPAFSELVL